MLDQLVIGGVSFEKNRVYTLENREDPSAPKGVGTRKLPLSIFGDTFQVYYHDPERSGKGVYDTGLTEKSPMYTRFTDWTQQRTKERVNLLKKYIVDEYEKVYSIDLSDPSTDFWDTYKVSVYPDRIFNMSNVKDRLDLFVALNRRKICLPENSTSPDFKDASYTLVDKTTEDNKKSRKKVSKFDAVVLAGEIYDDNPKKLLAILCYCNIIEVGNHPQEDTLKSMLLTRFDDSSRDVEIFLDTVKKYEEEDGKKDDIELFCLLKSLHKKRLIRREVSGEYTFKGNYIGTDFKNSAHRININDDLQDLLSDIIDAAPDPFEKRS